MPLLRIDPADPRPIWRQIEEGVQNLVAARRLAPGDPVPSVRDLARELQVNPGTVAKAYQRLVDGGILAVRRGEGTYVADALPKPTDGQRTQRLDEGAARYAGVAATLGATRGEAVERLRQAWTTLERGS
ncbi:MAG TPA: GntR family transcriptional regulator [Thermoanaerobaculia bacterium]|nr:GntR family transcriptional regulator [Thermoanaerobaculia bacterium]